MDKRAEYGLNMAHDFDFAGYTEKDGSLGKTVPPGHVMIPGQIRLEDGYINWQSSGDSPPKLVLPSKRLLDGFIKLWKLPEKQILTFAQANGVLDPWAEVARSGFLSGFLCVDHLRDGEPLRIFEWFNGLAFASAGREPISEWRRLSRMAWALLVISARLAQEKHIDPGLWEPIAPAYLSCDPEAVERLRSDASYARARLFWLLPRWVGAFPALLPFGRPREQAWLGSTSLSLAWNSMSARFEVQLNYHGSMLNVVSLQLALTISKADGLYICSGCENPYVRSLLIRRPKPGQRNFCPTCNAAGIASRQADERRRSKKKGPA